MRFTERLANVKHWETPLHFPLRAVTPLAFLVFFVRVRLGGSGGGVCMYTVIATAVGM